MDVTSSGIVFYCDDDEDDLFLFAEVLHEIDPSLQCITAYESEEALAMLSEGGVKPDIIFLDINIPKMNGIEMLAWLKRQHLLTNIPIIMYSTSLNDLETSQCKELGATRILPKLYTVEASVRQLKSTMMEFLPALKKIKKANG